MITSHRSSVISYKNNTSDVFFFHKPSNQVKLKERKPYNSSGKTGKEEIDQPYMVKKITKYK